MRNKPPVVAGILTLLVLMPFFVSALTTDELAAQIKTILAQIATLQQQLQTTQATQSPAPVAISGTQCPTLFRTLSSGARGEDVLSLQQFLIGQQFLSSELATGYFGSLTEAAVQRLQVAYGLLPSGSSVSAGYGIAGPRTRAEIGVRCAASPSDTSSSSTRTCPLAQPPVSVCSTGWRANTDSSGCVTSYRCALPLPQRTSPTSTVGACSAIALLCPAGSHDEVGVDCSHTCVTGVSPYTILLANPTSGTAPLFVTFELRATDSSDSSGIYYTIDFGDGQSTGFAHTSNPSILHRYAAAGTYNATVTRRTGCSSWECVGFSTVVGATTIVVSGTNGTPPFSINSPTSGQSVKQGEGLAISWDSQNAPTGSAVSLWLVKSSGERLGLIAGNQPVSSTFSWQVPGPRCNSSGVCAILVDSPAAYYTDVGTYWVVGNIYTPADAYLGGYGPANPTYPTYLATATSSLFNITGDASFQSFSASPTSGVVPLTVSFRTTTTPATNGSTFRIDFGDGTNALMQSDGLAGICVVGAGGPCNGYSGLVASHTYTSSGTYTATLKGQSVCGATNSIPSNPLYCTQTLGTVTITVQ